MSKIYETFIHNSLFRRLKQYFTSAYRKSYSSILWALSFSLSLPNSLSEDTVIFVYSYLKRRKEV